MVHGSVLNQTVAPAQAGADHVSPSNTISAIGSSLRWSDAVDENGEEFV